MLPVGAIRGPQRFDKMSTKDRFQYMCSAGYCTVLPLGLYVNILDLNIFGSQIILAAVCCAASFLGLVQFYHDSAKAKKHAYVCHAFLSPRRSLELSLTLGAATPQVARRHADHSSIQLGQNPRLAR